ncbi:protein adenylyltransferase SelO [Advenella mimigardefordensis]|nr:YdiU family protein [Advenella mimigardefordensis]
MLSNLQVSNRFASLSPAFYTRLRMQGLTDPTLLHVNPDVLASLGLTMEDARSPAFLSIMSGNADLPGGVTLSAVYSGHQFGVWAGQLGDGRAHLLGAISGTDDNGKPADWEIQLKGSGRTPYSRMGDGRAVLRSSVREYLASAAMTGLGIPTTQALCLVASDDPVYRETVETAAIVARVAPSFVRFGSFEHWYAAKDAARLRELLDYVISNFFADQVPAVDSEHTLNDVIERFVDIVIERTATLMAGWQSVGFNHGVMNTDNMSVLGLTLDYGPYGFMDAFRINHVCNHTDTQGRYAWNAQPSVGLWNLYRFANCFVALGAEPDRLKARLERYEGLFISAYRDRMIAKLGLQAWQEGDDDLIDGWWRVLHDQSADFTLSFRYLAQIDVDESPLRSLFTDTTRLEQWLASYRKRLQDNENDSAQARAGRMDQVNPLYVLRNYLAEEAIQAAAKGDMSVTDSLLQVLRDPYTAKAGMEHFAEPPPDWGRELEVSCSS